MLANWQSFIKSEVFYHRHCADIDFFYSIDAKVFVKDKENSKSMPCPL